MSHKLCVSTCLCPESAKADRDGDMQRRRLRDRVQMPALLGHPIANLVHVDLRVLGTERDNRRGRVAQNVQFRDFLLDASRNLLRGSDDSAAGLQVSSIQTNIVSDQNGACRRG